MEARRQAAASALHTASLAQLAQTTPGLKADRTAVRAKAAASMRALGHKGQLLYAPEATSQVATPPIALSPHNPNPNPSPSPSPSPYPSPSPSPSPLATHNPNPNPYPPIPNP